MILRVLWNGHLAWNWHLGRTGILPVSSLFSSGQDAHSTHIHSKIQQCLDRTYPILSILKHNVLMQRSHG
ncbi:MAG: hypothetical protein F6K49_16210 [Moorea sp. SIO3I6]|nr:hypothetical protein [Moorena sp. SIO3I6]